MTVTIRRPLYSGSGFALYNGSGLALGYNVTVESLEQAIYDLLTEVRAVLGGPNSTLASELLSVKSAVVRPPGVDNPFDNIWSAAKPYLDVATELLAPQYLKYAELLFNALGLTTGTPQVNTATKLDDIYGGTHPVTPVTPPPAGYGGGTAEEVWTYPLVGYPWIGGTGQLNTLDLLQASGHVALNTIAALGVPDPRNPFFAVVSSDHQRYYGDYGYQWYNRGLAPLDPVDWTLWNGTDSIVTFLTAQLPGLTWSYNAPWGQAGTGHAYGTTDADGDQFWLCLVRDVDLPYVSGRGWTATPAGGATPPIWPGEDGVTLGEPVVFDAPGEIVGPMAGVLVDYTVAPQKVDQWTVGGFTNYGHAGQLAFVSDNGYAEPWQYLQWGKQVYVPRALSVAASCLIRPIAGQEGTVTPWTVA